MKTIDITLEGETYAMAFRVNKYIADGSMAVMSYTNEGYGMEPFATLTVCLDVPLPDGWAFVDGNNVRGIADALANAGLAERTGYAVQSGFCEYEAMSFTDKFFELVA
jgi:hypothetical protein